MNRCPGVLLLATLLTACAGAVLTGPASGAGEPIRPFAENPRYWEYRGVPVMLIGGSREDNLFQIPDLEEHLDLLVGAGGNYVRNTMSSRDSGNVWPFERAPDGRYDLERLNDDYFDRLERLLRLAAERDIVVQVEVWDRFDFAREPWRENPYRPANNVNYSPSESGLADEYPRHPGQNDNPFFRSIPEHDHQRMLLRYQHAQVDRLLDISLKYPNVLYTMDNETSGTEEWGAYWSRYIRRRAAEAGVEVHTTEMWDAWDLRNEQHRRTLDHPELYTFVDISQNNHNTGQRHWDNLQWVRAYTAGAPRPLNHVKIYGADTGTYGTDRDAVERFWRSLIGGGASIRFHRPPSGIGLNDLARANLRSARLLLAEYDLFRAEPDGESRRLTDREEGEAYLSEVRGEQYAIYFPDGGGVGVDLRETAGELRVRWLDVTGGRWVDGGFVRGGGTVPLATPGAGHWVALIGERGTGSAGS